jgi:hypothetical protein
VLFVGKPRDPGQNVPSCQDEGWNPKSDWSTEEEMAQHMIEERHACDPDITGPAVLKLLGSGGVTIRLCLTILSCYQCLMSGRFQASYPPLRLSISVGDLQRRDGNILAGRVLRKGRLTRVRAAALAQRIATLAKWLCRSFLGRPAVVRSEGSSAKLALITRVVPG